MGYPPQGAAVVVGCQARGQDAVNERPAEAKMDRTLFPLAEAEGEPRAEESADAPRLKRANRAQIRLVPMDLESSLPQEHAARHALAGASSLSPLAPGGFAPGWLASVAARLPILPLAVLPPPPPEETEFDPSSPPRAARSRHPVLSPGSLPQTQLLEEGSPFIHRLDAEGAPASG